MIRTLAVLAATWTFGATMGYLSRPTPPGLQRVTAGDYVVPGEYVTLDSGTARLPVAHSWTCAGSPVDAVTVTGGGPGDSVWIVSVEPIL